MQRTLSLPIRNILRNRRRSAGTILMAAIGVSALLIFGGYARSVIQSVETGTIRQFGHLQVQRKNYFLFGSGAPADYGIAGYGKVIGALQEDPVLRPMLTVVTPTLQLQGIAGHFAARVSQTVSGQGMVVAEQDRLRLWNGYRSSPPAKPVALPAHEPDAVQIGVGVARILRLEQALGLPPAAGVLAGPRVKDGADAPPDLVALGEREAGLSGLAAATTGAPRIDLLAATAGGAPNVVNVQVAGAERLGVKEADDRYVAMHLPLAQRLVYGQDEPRVTSIILQLNSTSQLGQARARVQQIIAHNGWDLEALDFHTLNPSCGQIQGLFKSILGFFGVLIGAIILFSVANAMGNAVIERTAEIGTLRAMGMRRRSVTTLFLAEGALLGALGTVLGCLLGMASAFAINGARISWTPPNYSEKVLLTIQLFDDPSLIAGTVLSLSVLSMVSAVVPARRAGRIPVVEALRHV